MPGLPAPTALSAALSWPGSSLYSLIFLLAPSSDGKPARREGLGDLAPVLPFKVHLHGFQNGLGAKRLGEIGVRANQSPFEATEDTVALGEDNQRGIREGGFSLEQPHDLVAVQFRKTQFHKDEIRD